MGFDASYVFHITIALSRYSQSNLIIRTFRHFILSTALPTDQPVVWMRPDTDGGLKAIGGDKIQNCRDGHGSWLQSEDDKGLLGNLGGC